MGHRVSLDGYGKSGPQVVMGYVTLLCLSILQLVSSGFKLDKLQVLLPEHGGRLQKHVAGKIYVSCMYFVCTDLFVITWFITLPSTIFTAGV